MTRSPSALPPPKAAAQVADLVNSVRCGPASRRAFGGRLIKYLLSYIDLNLTSSYLVPHSSI